jgi:hypothetical protein
MPNTTISSLGFHAYTGALQQHFGVLGFKQDTVFTYTFENFFHPFVGELIQKLNRESLPGMLDPDFHQGLAERFGEFFDQFYETPQNSQAFREEHKNSSNLIKVIPSKKAIELEYIQPYANYNWELLFHIPLAIAVHLSKNQRFAEAQRWFHYIFDPTSNDTSVETPQRFWKFLAFRNGASPTRIDELLRLLSKSNPDTDDVKLRESILRGYEAIKNKPFQPHAVARTRQIAYQYCVVMKYLDNLIAWGDHLFRQDTIESLNEATQRYVLAANLLGERPERIPQPGSVRPKTFAELKKQSLDPLGNALIELEGQLPFNMALPLPQDGNAQVATPLFGIGRTLYFCVPHNDKLLGYWDTVADRLFKIRNCLNIEGVFRPLALFDPPLDPGMLVKAAAAGIDIRSMINGLNQPVGPVRCLFLIQKALELAGEVRGMGAALLSTIEKGDGERMALLRQGHEIKIQQMAQDVRFLQWQGARESTEALLRSRASVLERFHYYQRLLGLKSDDESTPEILPLDRREMTEENFDEAYDALVDQYFKAVPDRGYPTMRRAPEKVSDLIALSLSTGNLHLNLAEFLDINVLGPAAQILRQVSAATDLTTAALAQTPDAYIDMHYMGVGATTNPAGGSKVADSGRAISSSLNEEALIFDFAGSYASKVAGYQRRVDDWILQRNLAARELMQIGRQVIGSLIAEQMAYHEYLNIQKQIEQSQEVDRFLREKFTNAELFAWMQGELMRLYYEYYRFAFDTARKAEQTMKYELMRPEVDSTAFVKFNYWDGGRKGLLSGEALYLDVKRMELAYHENNLREFELTKHISLRQLNPLALQTLKATGSCEVTLPEWLFDLDGPGHYMRRIKHASLSIPAVAGPYTSVNCTLTLLKSSLRKSPSTEEDYPRLGSDDSRFIDYFGAIQSIVTSSGREDGGLFEPNLRDERFLPFEGAGAESTWRLELPAEFRQFDYNTLSDVILHLRYTARQGGDVLREKAIRYLQPLLAESSTAGLGLLFSLRHDYATEWAAFVNSTANTPFNATIQKDYFPYFTQGKTIKNITLDFYQDVKKLNVTFDPNPVPDLTELAPQFTVAAKEGLPRTADAQVFMVVKYTFG